jgi:antitoxin component of RelBE/YafQ-DinJ toxin-antitoxin module
MSQVAVTIKIDSDLKEDIAAFAKRVGLSFSSIVENKLREVSRERHLTFEDELVPNKKFALRLEKIQEDIKLDRNITHFNSNEDALAYLKSL